MGRENDHRQLVGEGCGSMQSGNWLEIFKTVNETYSRQIRKNL